jgi:hypothetical protein
MDHTKLILLESVDGILKMPETVFEFEEQGGGQA